MFILKSSPIPNKCFFYSTLFSTKLEKLFFLMFSIRVSRKTLLLFLIPFSVSILARADIYKGVRTVGLNTDGLKRTLVSQLLTGPKGEEFNVTAPPRTDLGYLDIGFERQFKLRLKEQKASKHLVVIIPGFGSTNSEGTGPYLSEFLHRKGFVTLVSNSPAAEEFVLLSSGPGAPGVQVWDAIDLYDMIQASKHKLEAEYGYKLDKVSVIGTSLGSINAAHLQILDNTAAQNKKIGFHRVFAINPPISNAYGVTAIDSMVVQTLTETPEYSLYVAATAFYKAYTEILTRKRQTTTFESVEKNSIALAEELTLDEQQLRFLVGFGFQSTVTKTLAVMEQRFAEDFAGTLMSDRTTNIRLFSSFLKNISFKRYRIVNPLYDNGHGVRKNYIEDFYNLNDESLAFTETESIRKLYPQLQVPGFHLITWEDDFLLRLNDVEWIQRTFLGNGGGNSIIFKRGGHLGGYYQADFQNYLLKHLD